MNIKPLGDRVLIKPMEAKKKTAGGIYIPDTAAEKTNDATVVAIGDGKEVSVKVGDRILYEAYAGTKITVEGEEHIILKSESIIAIIK